MNTTWYTVGGVGGFHLFHQVSTLLLATVNAAATGYILSTFDYAHAASAASVALTLFQLFLSLLVLPALLLAAAAPLAWFPLLASFRGSGFYLFGLGLLTLYRLGNLFGLLTGGACILFGIFFVLYGQLRRERGSKTYRALLWT
ncbi:hypothetical protein SPRG_01937 [Saprolegnia parasitica CBS 223.65]|uniref:Uncharacterized protein n=1 Tax=Saprolegnia parasitica (strain CBS 223.65) TaxID=695850 RepID=A0A067CV49_SAPPC|nr:hypothetical protein SPRG_01937 [Saprolegnia parasitica CBS 223.65]KDO33125.1 hypothetical protein SPRG_01937 [Saprolegnia parasitica CBS 223.65]|eukprot:XP_012195892.1 hypothetical protein SPRG_01937 [Saprolegnia parasitica CBS 223.65]